MNEIEGPDEETKALSSDNEVELTTPPEHRPVFDIPYPERKPVFDVPRYLEEEKSTTTETKQPEEKKEDKPLSGCWLIAIVAFLVAIICTTLFLSRFIPKETKTEGNTRATSPARTQPTAAPALPSAPISQCSTPCSMHVGWDIDIKSGGQPVLVKFYGKKEWLSLSGRGDEQFTLDQFNPGEAQFASPENAPPVQVQLFPAK